MERVQAAAARLSGVAHRTPLLTSATLDARCGARIGLKAELFQRGGSFKFRGAYNRLSLLDDGERARGVVAYSSGNHGGAVALAASLLGIHAVVVVPATTTAWMPSSEAASATAPPWLPEEYATTPRARSPASSRLRRL